MFRIHTIIKNSAVVLLFVATVVSIPFNSQVNTFAQTVNTNSTSTISQSQNNPTNSADAEQKMNEEKARIMKENPSTNNASSSDISGNSEVTTASQALGEVGVKPQTTSGYPVLVIDNSYNIPNIIYCLDWYNSSGATTGRYLLTTSSPQITAFPNGGVYEYNISSFVPTSEINNYNYPHLRMFNVSSLLPGTLTPDICAGITTAVNVASSTTFLHKNKTTTVYPTDSIRFLDSDAVADNEQNILPQINIANGSCNPTSIEYVENYRNMGADVAIEDSFCTFPLQNIELGKTPILTPWWWISIGTMSNACSVSLDKINLICSIKKLQTLYLPISGVQNDVKASVFYFNDPSGYFSSPVVGTITYNKVNFTPTKYLTWNDTVGGNNTWTMIANPSLSSSVRIRIQIESVVDQFYTIPAGGRITPEFSNLLMGPIVVSSENGAPVIVTQRTFTKFKSSGEYVGIDANSLDTKYYFTWNDTKNGTNTWHLVGNPNSQDIQVKITIGNPNSPVVSQTLTVPAYGNITPKFPNIQDGPITIESLTPLVAGPNAGSIAQFYATQRTFTSFNSSNEYAGIGASSLDTKYYFTWNDTVGGNHTWTLIGNPNATPVDVRLTIGNPNSPIVDQTYTIPAYGRITPEFLNIQDGPIIVSSVNGTSPIFATQRVFTKFNSSNEYVGIANSSLKNKYSFTWNDTKNGTHTWTLIGNPNATSMDVRVTIGNPNSPVVNQVLTIPAYGRITPEFLNIQDGPIVVTAINPANTFYATQRVFTVFNSSNEYAGIGE